ncbi:TetR/AcrR family transcriptional regulator [Nocardioides mangrovi]|uniref:TetR/AcrR family transcriptional regulator n=1 Tax=Nocardioides mangrovi TaxID=2874580 RepID=A0ABS7UBB3_9ACTN|nr:TetR/AcrR family transcriptional regulator [Nocardioides mangrovi]MBZ5738266.1 TetR/AcrR family transcriptional regulator [Nocardioides mangrovi]
MTPPVSGVSSGATKGDERRTALLGALEEQLRNGTTLDEINIADISRSAGVTRSAFYFYFENKAAAVASLYEEMIAEGFGAADLLGGGGSMRERTTLAVRAIFDGWGERRHLLRAVLDARAASPAVRDQWDAFTSSSIDITAEIIEAERAAGRAPAGPDAHTLATTLLDLNHQTLDRVVRAQPEIDWSHHFDAVVHVWVTAIYGSAS